MTANQYNWCGSINGVSSCLCLEMANHRLTKLQIAYIIFEAPSNLLLKRFSPHVWQGRIFLTWGIITACHAAVKTHNQLWALRFLLG